MMVTHSVAEIEKQTWQWLNQVVIGLNLCPFSARPTRENRVRLRVCEAKAEEDILAVLEEEMHYLDQHPAQQVETTLLVLSQGLTDFYDYNAFLGWAEQLIRRNGWRGVYQVASFHPDYCFAGADPEDVENLTNRSPWPILHLIREASLEKAVAFFEGVDEVPEVNRQTVSDLSAEQKRNLFPWLFNKP